MLSGEIHALMDEGEVLLKAGDVLIQRGTNHAWSNRGDEPAYVAFVLIDAELVGEATCKRRGCGGWAAKFALPAYCHAATLHVCA